MVMVWRRATIDELDVLERDPDAAGPLLADIALKDLNLHRRLYVGARVRALLLEQVERDCKWLEGHNVCDYSLLVGFHFAKRLTPSPEPLRNASALGSASALGASTSGGGGSGGRLTLSTRKPSAGAGPERSMFRSHQGGVLSAGGDEIYFFGIIDHLTEYNLKKRSEHRLKSLMHDSVSDLT